MINVIETTNSTEQFTVKEAAEYLGISPAGISARIFKGTLKAEKINGKQYIAREDLEKVKAKRDTLSSTKKQAPQEAEILSGVINTVLQQAENNTKITTFEEVTTQIRVWNVSTEHNGDRVIHQVIFDGRGFSVIS